MLHFNLLILKIHLDVSCTHVCMYVSCLPDSLLHNKEDIIHHAGCDSFIITTLSNIHLHSLTEEDIKTVLQCESLVLGNLPG